MNRLQKAALLIQLVDKMAAYGNWCAEPHIQKAVYFMQELLGVPMGFCYIFYKHGPFSFDLRDELTMLRADCLVDFQVRASRYAQSLVSTDYGRKLKEHYPKTLARYGEQVNWVAEYFGDKHISVLNRLATALYVIKKSQPQTVEDAVAEVRKLTPHVPLDEVMELVNYMHEIVAAAESQD